jgi:hypothetical protein
VVEERSGEPAERQAAQRRPHPRSGVAARKLLREHDRSGEPETPFFAGIRASLDDLDAYAEREESSAA